MEVCVRYGDAYVYVKKQMLFYFRTVFYSPAYINVQVISSNKLLLLAILSHCRVQSYFKNWILCSEPECYLISIISFVPGKYFK